MIPFFFAKIQILVYKYLHFNCDDLPERSKHIAKINFPILPLQLISTYTGSATKMHALPSTLKKKDCLLKYGYPLMIII